MQVEELLYAGNFTAARTILADVDIALEPEDVYHTYYHLYANYLENNGILSEDDSSGLYALCIKCPGYDGAAVYQARSLYNSIYNKIIEAEDCPPDGYSARKAIEDEPVNSSVESESWFVNILPNPTSGDITITTVNKLGEMVIEIFDISGRRLINQKITVDDHVSKLNVDLINGVYLVRISKTVHERVIKKLVISR
jgi:hypothetical protein